MTEFFLNYGLFFAKTLTFLLMFIAALILTLWFATKSRGKGKEHVEIKKLNDKYEDLHHALQFETLSKKALKKSLKADKQKAKKEEKAKEEGKSTRKKIFVLDFDGDIRASAVNELREEITAILTLVKPDDEVFVKVESGGGMVHAYGLASSQLMRIKDHDIPLTISVDKIAASGGYMMACVANTIISAPFAILGSIGVVAQIPNFNKLLKKNDIDYEQFTAGEYKRTVTMFGENTDKAKAKFKEDIEDTHELFKEFVSEQRPGIDIDKVATGEHWFGIRAKELNLVDKLMTSDDFLLEQSKDADLYEIKYIIKKPMSSKLSSLLGQTVEKLFYSWWQLSEKSRYQ